jgi:prepilin-type N-terminal cleavage/methylation domain-containing protein
MKNAFKLNSNLPPLSLPLSGGEVEMAGFFTLKGAEEMNCEYLSPKGGETTPSINLPLSGGEQKRGLFKDHNSKSAFTLVELAIVIVVLGILIGGVLTGQSIIESARISEAVTKVNQMSTALKAFNLEFDALPGDMEDAYDYFGDECGNDSTGGTGGCNGNGDKCLAGENSRCPAISNPYKMDIRRAFVHLNLSGIAPDINYQTNSGSSSSCANIAPDIMDDAIYILYSKRVNNINMQILPNEFEYDSGNSHCETSTNPSLTPKQAKALDEKLDNGNGRTGKIKAYNTFDDNSYSFEGTDCMDADGVYNVGNSDKACNLRVEDIY